MAAIYPVILAGGSGSRLWPLSRKNLPKQFIDPLEQGESLLQATVRRAKVISSNPPLFVANQEHRFLLRHQLSEIGIGTDNVLLESEAKNTASSVLLAALTVASHSPDSYILIMPSDHFISDDQAFASQIINAKDNLGINELCLFGVAASSPNPNYGYLNVDFSVSKSGLSSLKGFIEKPDCEEAKVLVNEKGFSWNSGIVLATAGYIVRLFEKHQAALTKELRLACHRQESLFDYRLFNLSDVEALSFDCAVLEKEKSRVLASLLKVEWDDIGTWPSLIERRNKLGLNEMKFGRGRSQLYLTGKDVVLVEDDDLVMVADVDRLSDMSAITNHLASTDQLSLLDCLDIFRPWGSFKVLAKGEGFLVKELSVFPGQQISLQSHELRVENWVVVNGSAIVFLDGARSTLVVGESLRVGVEQVHRLLNEQSEMLRIIEVQTGASLVETDIVRYDDDYLRHL